MPLTTTKKTSAKIDPNMIGGVTAKRDNPPTLSGGGMATAKKAKGGCDPDAFTNMTPKRSSPPMPKK